MATALDSKYIGKELYDLWFSADEHGYYLQRVSDYATSQLFKSAQEAWLALRKGGKIEWKK